MCQLSCSSLSSRNCEEKNAGALHRGGEKYISPLKTALVWRIGNASPPDEAPQRR